MDYQYFVIVPPGFESLAQKEIESKCPVTSLEVIKGGIEVHADENWMALSHCLLKIPTRILLRITTSRVRDFPKLFQKFKKFNWNQFLSHPNPVWKISSTRSRLNHTGRIEETLRESLADSLQRNPLSRDWEKKNYPPQTFYVRLEEDELTLALDLSGEPLYKRGLQKIKGEAPLRENLASAMLMELCEGLENEFTLVDPMCGSGTFLSEGKHFHTPLHLRPFAFETSPLFKGKFLRLPPSVKKLPLKEFIGFDLDSDLLGKVKNEIELDLHWMDSLKNPLSIPGEFLMICNPPYGERLKVEGKRGIFLKNALEKFLQIDRPRRLGWATPSDMDDLYSSPGPYKVIKKIRFKNGGIPMTFWVWEK